MNGLLRRLLIQDQALARRLTLPMESRWRWLPALGAHLGDGTLWFVVGGALLIWGTDFTRGVTLIAFSAVLVSAGVSTAIKYLVRRPRPLELPQFYALKHDRYSFPSGHATRMGAIAMVVGHLAPRLAVVGYALAVAVALCRIIVGVHYASDVFVGLLIGFIGARCVVLVL